MLERCRLYCQGNEVELHKIDLFENNYHSDNAIHEYTKDTFLYRILNRALRTEDMGTILDFRYFIVDLYNQLYKVQTDFDHYSFVVSEGHKLTVYRGQFMSMKELNQLKRNIGRYIIIQTFLSTTLSSDIALLYAGHESQNSLYESVLFVIDIDIQQNIRKRPLANIGQNGLWSKPYPPIDRSGYVDDHDRPFFLYHKQNATEISENKNFSLPASYEPWVKGKKGSNKLQLNVRKLAISGFSNVSRLNFVEYGLFKGEKKNGPPLMWSQFKKSSLDNETAAQLITSVEDNVGDIMVDFAFKAPRNAIKGYTG
ncbi:unnamed protein product [Rotaria magnacalcarata]|uniref:Uncharacterized protein n=1 Tax=Rotaria magnacalcarata TaxID=392030 RepID=A0A8S2VUH8_9BILA|nr:unnamed protein product [Rotaria magnacalcarata]